MVSGHGANTFDHAGYTKMATDDRFKLLRYDISRFAVLFPRDDVAVATYRVRHDVEMDGSPCRWTCRQSPPARRLRVLGYPDSIAWTTRVCQADIERKGPP